MSARREDPLTETAPSSSSWMRLGTGGPGGGGEIGGGGGEGGINAAAADASVLNVSRVPESTPSIVPSSVMGSMWSLVSTPVTPSALSEFYAAVSVESSTSASLKNTETSYVVAASDRRRDAAVAMHAPSELEMPALL